MSFQLLLTITNITGEGYEIKADTNLPDDASVKKVLKDALALMDDDPVEEENVSTYKASTPEDHKAGIYWPDPDARPSF